jgi:hypothetical protein
MRIATLYVEGTANAYYRVQVPLRELERRGHKILWPGRYPPSRVFSGTPKFDVFLLHHLHRQEDIDLVRRLREQGVPTVWDVDDDIFARRIGQQLRETPRQRRERKDLDARTVEVAREATVITTPSKHVAQRFRDEGAACAEVIENYVSPDDAARPRRRHQGIVIGLTAAREHDHDIKKLKIPKTLARLLEVDPGVRIVSIGLDLDLMTPRYRNIRRVLIQDLVAAEADFDIGIAPLIENRFNRGRSNVKVKEYAAAGAMWLASPAGPYVGMGPGQGGELVEDDAWFDTLARYVEDYRRRLATMEEAREWVRRDSATAAATRWEAAFKHALQLRWSDRTGVDEAAVAGGPVG